MPTHKRKLSAFDLEGLQAEAIQTTLAKVYHLLDDTKLRDTEEIEQLKNNVQGTLFSLKKIAQYREANPGLDVTVR